MDLTLSGGNKCEFASRIHRYRPLSSKICASLTLLDKGISLSSLQKWKKTSPFLSRQRRCSLSVSAHAHPIEIFILVRVYHVAHEDFIHEYVCKDKNLFLPAHHFRPFKLPDFRKNFRTSVFKNFLSNPFAQFFYVCRSAAALCLYDTLAIQ
jgi:hypothetical protein